MMDDFIVNMAVASLGLLLGGAVFCAIFSWLAEEFIVLLDMDIGDWIAVSIFFGVAAMIASTM